MATSLSRKQFSLRQKFGQRLLLGLLSVVMQAVPLAAAEVGLAQAGLADATAALPSAARVATGPISPVAAGVLGVADESEAAIGWGRPGRRGVGLDAMRIYPTVLLGERKNWAEKGQESAKPPASFPRVRMS